MSEMVERVARALALRTANQQVTVPTEPGTCVAMENWRSIKGYTSPEDWVRDTWRFKTEGELSG